MNWNELKLYIQTQYTERQNQDLEFLIDTSFQAVNRLFVLSFENEDDRKVQTGYYLPKAEVKDYNFMFDGKAFLICQLIVIWEHIQFDTVQGDNYTTGCLLDYSYFNKHYKMMAIGLSKQQTLEADSRAIQQINFMGNLDRPDGAIIDFIIEEAKETNLDFSHETFKVL